MTEDLFYTAKKPTMYYPVVNHTYRISIFDFEFCTVKQSTVVENNEQIK